MELKPLHDRVVVRRDLKEETTSGGIVLTSTAQKDTFVGTVMAVGTGTTLPNGMHKDMWVKEGDKVLFAPEIDYSEEKGEEEILIMRETNILAVIKE